VGLLRLVGVCGLLLLGWGGVGVKAGLGVRVGGWGWGGAGGTIPPMPAPLGFPKTNAAGAGPCVRAQTKPNQTKLN
jgi:hypothetical protein